MHYVRRFVAIDHPVIPAPDARYKRTVERIAAEAYWLKTYQDAMSGMVGVDAIGFDFFHVALNAIKDARLIRLIRVLEDEQLRRL